MRLRLALVGLATLFIAPIAPPALAAGIDETCMLALVKTDPATVNIAFPDDSAVYYAAVFTLLPGTRVRIHGQFPHARYMSLNVYDPALRPIAALNDQQIRPDAGSSNPFLVGADRTANRRDYTAFLDAGRAPTTRAVNTLYPAYTPDGLPNPVGLLIYRIYIPDEGTGETGGVGVPTVTLETTTTTESPAASPCTQLTKPSVTGVNELLATLSTPSGLGTGGGTNPPTWRKFVNMLSGVAAAATGTPSPLGLPLDELGGSGGFLSNKDNQYVSASIDRGHGDVVVTRMKVASFPDTRSGATTMPGGQLRYWSLCQNDPLTQRFIACLNDDRTVVDSDGFATFVVSPAALRPATATAECGVNWIPWGLNPRGLLILRNMLPDPGFTAAIQNATADREQETMGAYFPTSRYYADPAAYDARVGCHPDDTPPPVDAGSPSPLVTLTSMLKSLLAIR